MHSHKSSTAKISAIENGVKFTYDTVNAEGMASHGEFTAKFDGKDHAIKDSNTDSVLVKKIDPYTLEYLFKSG
jgi:hypothetical protein